MTSSNHGPASAARASQQLATYAAGLELRHLPADLVAHVKLCILDGLGCALYGASLPMAAILAGYARDRGGRPVATLWGLKGGAAAPEAAFVNGSLVHGFELDDLHKTSILHPTSVALPAALAVAQAHDGIGGATLIAAYVAGAELAIRAGICVGTTQLTTGFHPTGTLGPIAAAVSAGRIFGLTPAQMLHALGIGATQGAGLMSTQFESMVKRVHAGFAAQSGVIAADLAQRGLTGMAEPLECDYGGFVVAFGGADADMAPLTAGLGERFETADIGFKGYSACGSTHTSIDAATALRARGLRAEDVERVDIEATTATYLHVGWPYEPDSATRAQLNVRYATAVALMDGEAFVDQYSDSRIHDPATVALAGRVNVKAAPDLDALGKSGRHAIRMTVHTRDGGTLEAERTHAKGSPAEPLTRDEVLAKYHRLAGSRIGADRAQQLHDAVMRLDRAETLDEITGLLTLP